MAQIIDVLAVGFGILELVQVIQGRSELTSADVVLCVNSELHSYDNVV